MTHFLFLLRHAKSDWKAEVASDFERPLTDRGLMDASRMSDWLSQQNNLPTMIVSSPALRAYQTALIFAHVLQVASGDINFDKRIYEASVNTFLKIIKQFPESNQSILMIGHNPGMDSILQSLCKMAKPRADGKLMTTTAVAKISVRGPWQDISAKNCELNGIFRPKELFKC
ncbi:MAG: histidine phosphatase family protein [Nitrosopumilus sp.]|nr:histidine phosphatase family protein [Nitrosopumilus sp.]